MSHFNPSQNISASLGVFGLPVTADQAHLHLFPVPWEVTTSYGAGAALGPALIRQASEQIDLFDLETKEAYRSGYFMHPVDPTWLARNTVMKAKAQQVIQALSFQDESAHVRNLQGQVNAACSEMVEWVYQQTKALLQAGKMVGLVGGDHSTPLGFIRALSEKHQGQFGILHIDAHADLRSAYQGFQHSHASIMHNVMTSDFRPQKLVQVGIRDFCAEEFDFIQNHKKSIQTFFDLENKRRLLKGTHWGEIVTEIVGQLPEKVYVSFDIDGLDPALCPNTGTPVAGGLSMDQAFYLLRELSESGKTLIGFDLNEVSPGRQTDSEWDGNVGARVLYKLCGWTAVTNQLPGC